jgi:peptidoglycan/xylan/chitin deacetylase (PgdA/CDA1 family)
MFQSRSTHFLTALICMAATVSLLSSACSPQHQSGMTSDGQPNSDDRIFQKSNITKFELKYSYKVALTFDDGPDGKVTEPLLDLLAREHVRATFFLVGAHIPGKEHLLMRMRREGHIIGNHAKTHPDLSRLEFVNNPEKVVQEIGDTHKLLKPFLDRQKNYYFRAPYGAWKSGHAEALNAYPELAKYIGPIYWTAGGELKLDSAGQPLTSADWACWSPKNGISVASCADGYMHEIEQAGGGVVLMHDNSMNTLALAEELITRLKDLGYAFVTLDDMQTLEKYQ